MSWSAALRLALLQGELGETLDVATHATLNALILLEPNVASPGHVSLENPWLVANRWHFVWFLPIRVIVWVGKVLGT